MSQPILFCSENTSHIALELPLSSPALSYYQFLSSSLVLPTSRFPQWGLLPLFPKLSPRLTDEDLITSSEKAPDRCQKFWPLLDSQTSPFLSPPISHNDQAHRRQWSAAELPSECSALLCAVLFFADQKTPRHILSAWSFLPIIR